MKTRHTSCSFALALALNEVMIIMMIMVINESKSTEIYEETFKSKVIVKISQLQAVAEDDAVHDEEHQEAEEAAKQSEAQDEEDKKTGRRGL